MRLKFTFLLLLSSPIFAQNHPGARLAAMADAGIAVGDIWSVNANQAGLLQVKRPSMAINYHQPYAHQKISAQTANFALPIKHQVWALGLYRYGFEAYREQQIQVAYARAFGPAFSAALAFHYRELGIEHYGKSKTFTVDAGMDYQLDEVIKLGAHISNLSNQSYNEEVNYAALPLSIQFGAAYQAGKQVLLALALEQKPDNPIGVKMGLEYQPADFLYLRGGCRLQPFSQSAGLGLNWKPVKIDLAYTGQQALGYGTQIGLSYAF